MNKFEEYLSMAKISDFIHRKELEDEKKKTVCLVFAIIAGIAAIAAIAFGIYKYLSREDDVDDFEDDFEDDFDFEAKTLDASKVRLSDLFIGNFRKLLYVYDFGDN